MESYKAKYFQTCKEQLVNPSESVILALRESNKFNQRSDGRVVLNFSGCNLTTGDCQILSKCLATDANVEEYRFTDCLLCEDACKIILNALAFNKVITLLDLKGNNLRYGGSELISKLLKRSSTIRELYLEWNTLGMWDEGIASIAEGLSLNQSLRVLDMSNNQITHEGGEALASALKRNKFLQTLDLRWNNIGVMGGRALLSALSHNKYIINLLLSGNNIPSDTIKAISTAIQRNIDYHSIYEEHHSMARSLKDEIDHLQHEKSLQVSTLIDQLEKEKELHENLSETTRDRLSQMKSAIEELKSEKKDLKQKNEELQKNVDLQTSKLLEVNEKNEELVTEKKDIKRKQASEILAVTESLNQERRMKQQEDMEKQNHIFELQKSIKELKSVVEEYSTENLQLQKVLKKIKADHEAEVSEVQGKHVKVKEELQSEMTAQTKTLSEKIFRQDKEKDHFQEEIARLKSNAMNDKLRHDEDLINQRAHWKQEELLKSKQYDERIDLLVGAKDELQMKISKLSVENSEVHSKLVNTQKECEMLKRQIDQQQQLLNQKDLEYRNDTSRLRTEIDGEKRVNSDSRDKIQKLENQIQELNAQLRELKSLKDAEISALQTSVKLKEDEIRKIRDDELRRAGMLETALQSYISSARSAHK